MATHGAVKLKRELAQVPITAVAFYRDAATGALYVLAGEDTDLVIYHVSGPDASLGRHELRTPVARVRILHAQPIHGIRVHQPAGRLLLWGGSSVALLTLADLPLRGQAEDTPPPRVAHLQAPDWIYDGAVCAADDALAVLVTAHNEVVTVRLDEGAATARLASALVSPSRPMLYAAHVCWTAADEVLVAAGTVFGDILVWTYKLNSSGGPRMLYALSGHEGSIFGVHVSPLLEIPGEPAPVRLLASCSDDRTIRIWNISEGEAAVGEEADTLGDETAAAAGVSDTGFRCAPAVYGGGGSQGRADVKPIATAMGHASRIWGVQFGLPGVPALTDAERRRWSGAGADGLLTVYSFGEDATAQRWRVDVAAALRETGHLVHDKTYTLHDGKHLWSRAVLCRVEDGVPTTRVLAGGADSKITLVTETADPVPGCEDVYSGAETWDMHDILAALGQPTPAPASKPRKELIGRYDFVTPDVLLAVTSAGRVLLGAFSGARATWEELAVADEATRADMGHVYAVKTVCYSGALLGCVTGGVYYVGLRDRRVVRAAGLTGRVVEMSALSGTARGATGDVEALVHLHRDAASVLLTLDRDTGAVKSQETMTGLDSRFVAMSAARIDDVVAVGSRHGWIALLRRDDAGALRPILQRPPASSDAVTAIVPLPASPTAPAGSPTKYVLTTSRDGTYRIFQLDVASAGAQMTLLHETAPPFGPWIEGAWFTADAELVLYGFRSTDFVVWNETRREALASWDCGGAHRTFRLARDDGGGSTMRLAFTRTSRLAVHSQRGSSYEPVRRGGHGREVRSLAAANRIGGYVATGAEDTTIRLWAYEGSGEPMRYLACMKRHVAGLQKVQWAAAAADGAAEYLFSSGGNEELFAWRVRALDSAYAGRVAVVCEGVFADKSAREDLRIMDFDASPDSDSGGMLLTMARSDSALRTYRYTAASGFALVCAGRYTGACLTQVRHLETSGNGALHVLTASTDGHVALWRGSAGGTYELAQTPLRVHQSSVKSLDMVRLADGDGYGVATGGDDNALAWTLLRREGEGFRGVLGAVVKRAHAAAVTGVALADVRGEMRCVSVSNDQWVRTWRVGEGEMRLLGEAYSGVADAGDVVTLQRGHEDAGGRRVMVAGVGLEVWRLE